MENIVYRSKGWISRVLGKMVGWYRKVFRGGQQPQVQPLGSVCEPTRSIWSRVESRRRANGENRINTKGEIMAISNDSSSGRASDGFASGGFVSNPREAREGDIPTVLSEGDYGAALRHVITGFDYASGPDRAVTAIYPTPSAGEESANSTTPDSIQEAEEDAVDIHKRIRVRRGAVAVKVPEPRKEANKTVHMGNGTLAIGGASVEGIPDLRFDVAPPRTEFSQSLQRDIAQGVAQRVDNDSITDIEALRGFGRAVGNAARAMSGRSPLVSFAMDYDVHRLANILHIVFLPGTPNAFEYHETVDISGMPSRNTGGIDVTEGIVARFVETGFNLFMDNLRTTVMRAVIEQLRSRR